MPSESPTSTTSTPARIQQCREAGVVGGQAGDLLAALLHLLQRAERHRRAIGVALLQLGVHRQSE